jgi:hypothetical protein
VVRYLAGGASDASLRRAIEEAAQELGPIEEMTRQIAKGFQVVDLSPGQAVPPAVRTVAYVEATAHHGKYDKTSLLLMGQERASLAAVLDKDTFTLAARFDSGVNFLDILGLSGGMPTLVSVSRTRMSEAFSKIGVAAGEAARLVG